MLNKFLEREAFLKRRKQYLGGSDIAAICGLSPWRTSMDVYLDKTSQNLISTEMTEPQHFGIQLESIIAGEYEIRTGNTVELQESQIIHPEYSFAGANIDRWVNNKSFILECKTTSFINQKEWGEQGTDQIPDHYLPQVAWYAFVCDVERVDIAVLIGGQNFKLYTYIRNKELEDKLLKIAKRFWENHVLKGIPPEPTSDYDVIKLYPESMDESIKADTDIESKIYELNNLKANMAEVTERIKQLQMDIQSYMGVNSILTDINGNVLASWKSTKPRKTFDSKKLEQEMPDIYKQYITEGKSYRTFLIKAKGNEYE